jgi:hypothetical protein
MSVSILKKTRSYEQRKNKNKKISFGKDIIHIIPNREQLFFSGEIQKAQIGRFKIERTLETETLIDEIGRFLIF